MRMLKAKSAISLILFCSALSAPEVGRSASPGSSPLCASAFVDESISAFNSIRIVNQLGVKPPDLLPFEISFQALATQLAREGRYLRRPTTEEIEAAFVTGRFPRDPDIAAAMLVEQKDHIDFSKPGILRIATGTVKAKKWNDGLDWDAVEKSMVNQVSRGEIVSELTLLQYKSALGSTGLGLNTGNKADRIQMIQLRDGTRGIFKAMSLQQAVAEVAAYRIAKLIGINLVPPTVLVKHKGAIGSFQYFIENPASGLDATRGAERFDKISDIDHAKKEIFYIVSGNWDAHPGNLIVDMNGGLGLIDNEAITRPQFFRYGEIPWIALFQIGKKDKAEFYVAETQGFPFENARFFNKPTLQDFQSTMTNPNQYDPGKIKEKLLWYQQDNARIGVLEWANTLWVQLDIAPYYFPRVPRTFPAETIHALSSLKLEDLKRELQKAFEPIGGQNVFSDADLIRMLNRVKEVLTAARAHGA